MSWIGPYIIIGVLIAFLISRGKDTGAMGPATAAVFGWPLMLGGLIYVFCADEEVRQNLLERWGLDSSPIQAGVSRTLFPLGQRLREGIVLPLKGQKTPEKKLGIALYQEAARNPKTKA
jgi:hypothetical protein